MKLITAIILTALLAYATSLFFPWWTIAITSTIVGFAIVQKPLRAFLCGFVGVFMLWLVLNLVVSNANGNIMASKASLLLFNTKNIHVLFLASAFIGGVASGLGALVGCFARTSKTA